MKATSSLDSSCFSHIKRRLSLITRILVNTRLILLLVVSLTSLLAQSRLYKGDLCLLRVQYHSLLCGLTTEEVRLCYSMYLLTGTSPSCSTSQEVPVSYLLTGLFQVLCEYKEEYFNDSCCPYWDILSLQICKSDWIWPTNYTFPITIPIQKFNIVIKCKHKRFRSHEDLVQRICAIYPGDVGGNAHRVTR